MSPERPLARNDREHVTSRLRLREHDYRLPGPYFVTACTQNRVPLYGRVSEGMMEATPAGDMLDQVWRAIPSRYPNVRIDGFVVMPNHIHGILTLDADENGDLIPNSPMLSDVIRWFKIQSTIKYIDGVRDHGWTRFEGKLWQPGFMDHIIRSEAALTKLRAYIENNPAMWEDDTFHPDANHALQEKS
jgi:putative transposase